MMDREKLELLGQIQDLLGITYTGSTEEELDAFLDKWLPELYDVYDDDSMKGTYDDEY